MQGHLTAIVDEELIGLIAGRLAAHWVRWVASGCQSRIGGDDQIEMAAQSGLRGSKNVRKIVATALGDMTTLGMHPGMTW